MWASYSNAPRIIKAGPAKSCDWGHTLRFCRLGEFWKIPAIVVISAARCGVCVTHAAGLGMRLPRLFILAALCVATRPPAGRGWAHELKHDGYRLQIHVREGRVRLYTMNSANWSDRYPLIIEAAARIKGTAILDAEVVWIGPDGVTDFDALGGQSLLLFS